MVGEIKMTREELNARKGMAKASLELIILEARHIVRINRIERENFYFNLFMPILAKDYLNGVPLFE